MQVAAVAPSSKYLAERMGESLELGKARTVVELGPGSGALTKAILPRMAPGARYLAVERNPRLAKWWRRKFEGYRLVEGCVGDLAQICAAEGLGEVDCIVSGLPWPAFSNGLQDRAIEAIVEVLAPGGQIATFGYAVGLMMPGGQRFLREAKRRFQRTERLPWEWRNLPPAYVLRCTR